ncbi:MAG: UPF0175 family protein [Oscillatoria sp. SIO1A7]|nr:UPF0175 family protein [Oscillatoria sp. SIO1A7]
MARVIEVKFAVADVPDRVASSCVATAERKAKEAFVMELLRPGEISAGRAAEILSIDRWQLSDLMSEYGICPFDETVSREDLEREVAIGLKVLEKYKGFPNKYLSLPSP